MSLADAIKQLSHSTIGASNPVSVMFGTITKTNPLEVNVDQRFILTEDFLILTERLTRYEIDLRHKHDTSGEPTRAALTEKVVIREGLKVGDSVLLLRVQGGTQYIVWDKVVNSS